MSGDNLKDGAIIAIYYRATRSIVGTLDLEIFEAIGAVVFYYKIGNHHAIEATFVPMVCKRGSESASCFASTVGVVVPTVESLVVLLELLPKITLMTAITKKPIRRVPKQPIPLCFFPQCGQTFAPLLIWPLHSLHARSAIATP